MTSGSPKERGELIDELHRLAGKLQQTPRVQDLRDQGRYSYTAYRNEFGSWNEALKAAGFTPNKQDISREDLIDEIQRMVDEEGEVPTKRDLKELSKYSYDAYRNEFGSWNEAVLEAGFEPNVNKIPREDLLEALCDLAERLERVPRVQDMIRKGRYSWSAYRNEFGSWNHALRAVGLRLNLEREIPEQKLLAEIHTLADGDEPPTSKEMRTKGEYSIHAYVRAFGSWNDAVREAGYEPHLERETSSGGEFAGTRDEDRYGSDWADKSYDTRQKHGRCLSCDVTQSELEKYGESLSVHHVTTDEQLQAIRENGDEEPKESRPEKLVTLCPDCHREWEKIGIGPDVRGDDEDEGGMA